MKKVLLTAVVACLTLAVVSSCKSKEKKFYCECEYNPAAQNPVQAKGGMNESEKNTYESDCTTEKSQASVPGAASPKSVSGVPKCREE